MLNLWKQTSEQVKAAEAARRSMDSDDAGYEDDRPRKKRKTATVPLVDELPRPTTTAEQVYSEVTQGNGMRKFYSWELMFTQCLSLSRHYRREP